MKPIPCAGGRAACFRLRSIALLCAAALVLAGCGEKEDALEPSGSKRIELMLDYFPNADHAGIYAAQAGGHFEQAGLDVEIRQPPDPAAPIKQVAAGRVDLAISYEPEVLRARDQGLSVVSVGAIVREPLTSIVSLPEAKIDSPRDLRGKTVGTAGIDYQSAYLRTILREAGVPADTVTERNVGFSLTPALLTGRVDAVLGAFWNYEGTELRLRGRRPRIIRMDEAGVPPTTSWCWWPTRTRSSATATRSAPSSERSRAARATCASSPTRRSTACWRPIRTSTPSCSARSSR